MTDVPEKLLEKELFTFCKRTENQLKIRVKMLFDPLKLQACRLMAEWCGLKDLEKMTRQKLEVVLSDVFSK